MATLPSDEDVIGRISDLSDNELLTSLRQAEQNVSVMGPAESDDDLLASLSAAEARLNDPTTRFMEEVRRPIPPPPTEQEILKEEMWQERWGRKDTPETLKARLGLIGGQGMGSIMTQVGRVIEAAPSPVDWIPGLEAQRKRIADPLIKAGTAMSKEYRELGEASGVRGGNLSELAQILGTGAVQSAPSLAAAPFGLPIAAITAGLQSFGGTYDDAINSQKMSPGAAKLTAVAAGLTTGLITAGFGNTGIEAMRNGLTRTTISNFIKEFSKHSGLEGLEEMADQAGQSIIQVLTYRPEMTLEQAIKENVLAGVTGAGMGGAVRTGMETAGRIADPIETAVLGRQLNRESAALDEVVDEATRNWVPPAQRGFAGGEKRAVRAPLPENTYFTITPGVTLPPNEFSPNGTKTRTTVQVDIRDGSPAGRSTNIDSLRSQGFSVPDGLESLPAGQYSLEQATQILNQDPLNAPFRQKIQQAMDEDRMVDFGGGNWFAAAGDRPAVFMRVGNGVLPFYRSAHGTGGNKKAGEWQPFFGFGDGGWLIKGSGAQIANSYGSPEIRAVQQWLNQNFNWSKELDQDLVWNRQVNPLNAFPRSTGIQEFNYNLAPQDGQDVFNHIEKSLMNAGVLPQRAPGPVQTGQGAAALGVPLQRPGVEVAPPQEPTPPESFAGQVTPPGQRGRILTSQPASYTVDVTPPGRRGRQLETAPPSPPDRTPLPRAYPGLVEEAQRTRQQTLPSTAGPAPSAHLLRAQLTTRMGESTVPGQPGFEPSTQRTTPPEDRPRPKAEAPAPKAKPGKMAARVKKVTPAPAPKAAPTKAQAKPAPAPAPTPVPAAAPGLVSDRVVFPLRASPEGSGWKGWVDKHGRRVETVPDPNNPGRQIYQLVPGEQMVEVFPPQPPAPAPAPKPAAKPAKKAAPKKTGDKMGDLMARIAAKEAAKPTPPAPTPAPVTTPVVSQPPPRVELTAPEPTEADVPPADDRILARAGLTPVDIARATDRMRRQANLGYAVVNGKWQKVTGPIYEALKESIRNQNLKRLRNIATVRDYAVKHNLKPDSRLEGMVLDRLLGTDGADNTTLNEWLTRADQQVKNSNAYLHAVGDQRHKAMSGLEGFIAGSKAEKWADQTIAEGQKRLNAGLDPVLLAAYGIKALSMLERGVRGAAEIGTELLNQFGEAIRPHLDRIMERAMAMEQDPELRNDAINLLKMNASSLVTAQIPAVQEAVDRIKAETLVRNVRGQKPVLTGEALDRQRAWDQVAAHPFIRKNFIAPVEKLTEQQTALEEGLQNYYDFKSNPESTPAEVSGAAGLAWGNLERFYGAYFKLRNEYAAKREQLQKKVDGAIEAHAETKGELDVLNQLLEDFVDISKEMMRQQQDIGARRILRKALKQGPAVRNTLGFIAKEVDLSKRTADTTEEIVRLIEEAAARHIKEDRPLEAVVGATRDIINDVAEYVALSEPLRQRIEQGHEYLVDTSKEIPISKFKTELAKLVKAGQFNAALRLFVSGVGSTATEKAATAKAANFFKNAVRKGLIDIEALDQVMALAQQVEQSPEFRGVAGEVYGDLGVREVMRGVDGTTMVLHPIYDEEPTVISFDTDRATSKANLQALKEYRDRALVYLGDPTATDYDPRKAAALQAFLDDADQLLDPSINPESGKLVEAMPRRVFRTIFGFLGRPDLIPQFALDRTAGPASDLAHRTLNAYQTMQELKTSVLRAHHQRLRKAEADAMDSHGMMGDIETYRDQIFAPIAASMQYFEGIPFRAGQSIGNGQTVTKEDINYFHEVRAFERAMINAAGGVGERAFRVIQANPGGILYKQGDKTYVRMPFETGPGTVHRRLRGRMSRYSDEWNKARGAEGKIDVLNKHSDRLVFGYLSDVVNPKFNFNYAYGPQLREILAEARGGNPVGSFEDLVQRIVDRMDEDDEGSEVTPEQVQDTLLAEFGQMFDRFKKFNQTVEHGAEKSMIQSFGGENSFNTERGTQIVPSLWYDYGSVGISERLGFLHNSTVKFAIEHYRAIEALERTLSNLVNKFKDRNVDKATTRSERDKGEEFYSWNEAIRTRNDVTNYKAALKKALDYQVKTPEIGQAWDPHTQAGTGLSFVVASLLAGASANIMNTFGGGLNIALFDQTVRNQGLASTLSVEGAKGVARVVRDLTNLAVPEPVLKMLKEASTAPLVGGMAEALFNYVNQTKELYRHSRQIGLNLNVDLVNTLLSEWRWRHSGGVEAQAPDNVIAKRVIKPLETMLRMVTEVLKQGTVGFVDSRLNTTAVKMTEDLEQDLMNRAIEYGQLREQRAAQEGRDPYDVTDLRNRFSDQELVGGRLNSSQAVRLRDLLRRYGAVNVDAAMMRFYQKWVEAGKPEQHDLKMFDEATRNQVALAISGDINQATFANRPIITRSGKTGANLGLFLGYPAFEMYKLAGLADRVSRKGMTRGHAENIPMLISAAITMMIIGGMGVGLSEEARRRLLNRQSPFPTIFNFNQSPKSYALTLLAGAMSMFPFYGGMVNAATQRAYKTGYDLNSRIMVLNLATDLMRLVKEVAGSGEFLRPATRFATRWSFPLNWVGPHLPMMSGLTEVSQARNSLSSAARQIGLEANLKAPFNASDVTYTSSTGPLNEFMNAVGNGDLGKAQAAFSELVKVRQRERDPDPVMSAQRAVAARNPLVQVFGARPTEMEMSRMLSVMRDDDRARVQNVMRLFDTAIQQTGGRPVRFVQEARSGRGGGGSESAGTGGSIAYAGPPSGGFSGAPAPAQSVRYGGGGAGGSVSSIGPAATFRIRAPKLRRSRLKKVGFRRIRRGGKLRSRLRRRR